MIKRAKLILKKLPSFLKDKGIIITSIKIYEYLLFRTAERKKRKAKPLSILKDDITVITNSKGVSLIAGGRFITNNVGFHSAIKNLEKWHDSTQAEFKFIKRAGSLIIKEWWWNLPLKYKWVFTLKERSILWKGSLIVENYIMIEVIKTGLIVNNIYDSLVLGKKSLDLPEKSLQWQEMDRIGKRTLLTLGVKDNPLSFPDLKFKIINSLYPCKMIVQNTDNYLNGRLLQMIMEDEREYRSGEYELFELEISVIKK
ncbi:MAG: hypothetical protein P9L98_04510 [Candidatus Kaelpia imicola]|nr:hypothetical protein [Candidatus Kaelpia imicola]